MLGFLMPELREVWGLGEYELGGLVTFVGCGSIAGELIFGALADKYGRRIVFLVTVLFIIVFGISSAMAPSAFAFAILRFFVGFGYGGCIAVDFTLYSEFLPTEGRGKMLFMLSVFWPAGQICTCLLASWLIPTAGWRTFVASCAVPIIFTACTRPLIPESPRWLLLNGRGAEATEVCIQMAEMNGRSAQEVGLGDSFEVCLDNETSCLESPSAESKVPASTYLSLFNSALWRTTCGLVIYAVALNYISYGTCTLMPSLLEMKGIPKASMYRSMLNNSLAQIPGCAVAAIAASWLGRLGPMQAFLLIVSASLISFAFATTPTQVALSSMLASGFVESGWAIYHVYTPEVFPTDIRAFATGFLSASGSIMAAVAPIVSASLIRREDPTAAIFAFSSVGLSAAVITWLLLHIETKDRDLYDVAATLPTGKSASALQ